VSEPIVTGYREPSAGHTALVEWSQPGGPISYQPGTVTVQEDGGVLIEGWTATNADLGELAVFAREWAIEKLRSAAP
jgi:hypothetical protein